MALLIGAVASVGVLSAAYAQEWPTKPVTLVVPFGPGASNDLYTRAIAEILSKKLGQPFVVENRAGAGGLTGANSVAQSEPDGYTWLESPQGITVYKPVLNYDLDPTEDLIPVTMFARAPYSLVVNADLGINTVQEFVDYVKAQPDNSVFFGYAGTGTQGHFLPMKLNLLTGIRTKDVNYKSLGEAILDLVAGRLQYIVSTAASVVGQVEGGQVKIIAYTDDSYSADSPPAQTFAEQGIEGMEIAGQGWWGFFAPAGTPDEIVDKMRVAIQEAAADPSFAELLARNGSTLVSMTSEEFKQLIIDEGNSVAQVVEEANIVIPQ